MDDFFLIKSAIFSLAQMAQKVNTAMPTIMKSEPFKKAVREITNETIRDDQQTQNAIRSVVCRAKNSPSSVCSTVTLTMMDIALHILIVTPIYIIQDVHSHNIGTI
jgi:hypothetical protein